MSDIDNKVIALLDKVRKKKPEIKAAERPSWQTNLSFGFVEDSTANRIAINVTTSLKDLINIVAFLKRKNDDFVWAASSLNLHDQKFSWMGFSTEAWVSDCETRIATLEIAKKKQELDKLEKRVNDLVTPEQKRKFELEALEKELA
jgi:hypothetical protein